MSSSRSKFGRLAMMVLWALSLGLVAGCIADAAEDSDLPWSTNQNWEGLGPLPSVMTDRND